MEKDIIEYDVFVENYIKNKSKVIHNIHKDYDTLDYIVDDSIEYLTINDVKSLINEIKSKYFIATKYNIKDRPLEINDGEVLAYNKEWIDQDYTPSGIRIGFMTDDGFISAKWNNTHDCYDTKSQENDDYDFELNGIVYYNNDGKNIIGCRPNMPSDYIIISKI